MLLQCVFSPPFYLQNCMILYNIEECNGCDKLPESPSGIKEPLSQPLGVPPTESPHLPVPFGGCHSSRELPSSPKAMFPPLNYIQGLVDSSFKGPFLPTPAISKAISKGHPISSFPAGYLRLLLDRHPSSTAAFAHPRLPSADI